MNDDITVESIRLIDADGEQVGVVSVAEGIDLADEAGLDLVEISPNASPPVCKILDYGKYKYEAQKKANEARKKQKTIDVKEVKFRPNTDTHDYDVKMRNVLRFLEGGDKVKVTLRFRGREMAHQNLGRELLERVAEDVKEVGKIDMADFGALLGLLRDGRDALDLEKQLMILDVDGDGMVSYLELVRWWLREEKLDGENAE